MATTAPSQTIVPRSAQPFAPAPQVDIVVPVFNEEADLARSVFRLYAYLTENVPFTFRVTIADNASADQTWPIAQWLAEVLPGVRAVHLEQRGRGRALRTVWQASDAGVLAYMDVDLSTDLAAWPSPSCRAWPSAGTCSTGSRWRRPTTRPSPRGPGRPSITS